MDTSESYSSRGKNRDSGRHGSSRDHHSSRSGRDEHGDRDRERDRGERRRRSRSPHHRSSRRDFEQDHYSSSRDYREREREDKYRDRRDDRAWDRDRERGADPRRDPRDHGDRPPRRERPDRDLFDERRGGSASGGAPGGGGSRRAERDAAGMGGGAGGGGGARDRKKSATPPPRPKEPTPDLTDIVPVSERRRRLTQWDIKPPGYENVTAEQAKLSGMFPLPGAPRQQPVDPTRLQVFMNQPATSSTNNAALKPSNARQAKRLFVHNIPPTVDENALLEFFNLHLNGLNVVQSVDPCLSAQMAKDRAFALLEFKSSEETTVALAFDGITMEDDHHMDTSNGSANGQPSGLSIRRPKDYIMPTLTDDTGEPHGVLSNTVRDSANKLSIIDIPTDLTDDQVNELLTSFGELKSFILVKDTGTDQSKGIAFCEFSEPETTDMAVEGLNGMEVGNQVLRVQRASIGSTQAAGMEMGVTAMSMLAGTTSADLEQGRVIQLLNMVTPEELLDNEEYAEICADVKEECEKFGKVEEMKVPRPTGGSRPAAGVGKIYVKFDTTDSAQGAMKALAGRKFADRTVVVTFFGEEYFNVNAW